MPKGHVDLIAQTQSWPRPLLQRSPLPLRDAATPFRGLRPKAGVTPDPSSLQHAPPACARALSSAPCPPPGAPPHRRLLSLPSWRLPPNCSRVTLKKQTVAICSSSLSCPRVSRCAREGGRHRPACRPCPPPVVLCPSPGAPPTKACRVAPWASAPRPLPPRPPCACVRGAPSPLPRLCAFPRHLAPLERQPLLGPGLLCVPVSQHGGPTWPSVSPGGRGGR